MAELSADYVSNEEALRYILERLGYRIIEGDFTRGDGSRARIAVLPPEAQPEWERRLTSGEIDGEPRPSDGPDYHADHRAWERQRAAPDAPRCVDCNLKIYGGKGDWWHITPDGRPGEMRAADGHLAYPKEARP